MNNEDSSKKRDVSGEVFLIMDYISYIQRFFGAFANPWTCLPPKYKYVDSKGVR